MQRSTQMYFLLQIFLICLITIKATESAPSYPLCYPGHERIVVNGSVSCKLCEDGFFSRDGQTCQQCKQCDRTQTETNPCLKTHDRQCVCPPGQYFNLGKHTCTTCSNCSHGLFQVRSCESNLDRECLACPAGKTSEEINSKKCVVTVIIPVPQHVKQHMIAYIVAACIITASVILTIIFIVWFCMKRKRRNRYLSPAESDTSCTKLNNDFQLVYQHAPIDPSLGGHIRHLSATIMQDLGARLNPRSHCNWRTLAARLNFTQQEIGNYELTPREATQDMLMDWGTRAGATVNRLYLELRELRPDAAEVIKPVIEYNHYC